MRTTKSTKMTKRQQRIIAIGKQEQLLRRSANHRAHVITAHGKIMAGRKGR